MEPTIKRERGTKSPEQALNALMRLCARAEKSSGDARRLMRGWGLSAADAEGVLRQLVAHRFVDDQRYAAAFVREKTSLNGWGVHKIRAALRRKEVAAEVIEEALRSIDREAGVERLQQQLLRKNRTLKAANAYERRTKLLRYGLSLGYDYGTVSEVIPQIVEIQEDICEDFF